MLDALRPHVLHCQRMEQAATNKRWPTPFAVLLGNKSLMRVILLFLATQAALIALGLRGWPCPMRHGLGIPCPGCGMTRAALAMLHGDWSKMLQYNAFAPAFSLALVLMIIVCLLPTQSAARLTDRIAALESRTGLTVLTVAAFLLYWLARLLIFPHSLDLVRG